MSNPPITNLMWQQIRLDRITYWQDTEDEFQEYLDNLRVDPVAFAELKLRVHPDLAEIREVA